MCACAHTTLRKYIYVYTHTHVYIPRFVCLHMCTHTCVPLLVASRHSRVSTCMCQRSQKHVTLTRGTRIFDTGSSHDKLIGDVAPLSFGASLPRSNGGGEISLLPSEGHVTVCGGLYHHRQAWSTGSSRLVRSGRRWVNFTLYRYHYARWWVYEKMIFPINTAHFHVQTYRLNSMMKYSIRA